MKPRAEASLRICFGDDGLSIDRRAVRLLELIDVHGSIRIAATALGVSYRTAWITIDKLKGAGEGGVVYAARGGADNGSRLTSSGRALVDHFRRTERQLDSFLENLNGGWPAESGEA